MDIAKTNAGTDKIRTWNQQIASGLILDPPLRPTLTSPLAIYS